MLSFTSGKLLSLFVYPLSLSLMLAALGLLFTLLGRRRLGFFAALIAGLWLYVCSTSSVANYLTDSLERDFVPRAMSVIEPAQAIVLLGGAVRGDTHMGTLADLNQQADRILHAAHLFQNGKAPLILLSGGAAPGNRPDAEQVKDILLLMGVPAHLMLLEKYSRNTYYNAVYSAKMLKDRGITRILLVTSAFHMRRALALFEAQGMEVTPAPTDFQRVVGHRIIPGWLPGVANLARTTHALHELVGYQVYRWRGWL